MDAFRLNNDVVLITGGGSGLGFGMAQCFIHAGARVVLVGRREEVLQEAAAALGEAATYEVQDVTRFEGLGEMVERVNRRVGRISILVNNAGVHLKKPAIETTEAEFISVFQTHVFGAFALTRRVLPAMLAAERGSILFTASMSSLIGLPNVIAYSGAKSAYLGLVRALAAEVSPRGVRVNAIAPGWIESPMLRQALAGDHERKQKILSRTPMGTFGNPEDVGWAAVYLCSPAARFVTGTVLPIDGGASIGF